MDGSQRNAAVSCAVEMGRPRWEGVGPSVVAQVTLPMGRDGVLFQ
jgi:hypothetical protein